ncbi:MAG: hypothetical protein ACSLE2_17360 [Lysobacterales bacterium]
MSQLEQNFENRIRAAVLECHQLGYHPSDFEGMLSGTSATRVAEKLVTSGKLQTGLQRLAQMGRLDLSVESIMLETQFETLFTKQYLEAAQWRLNQVSA